MIRFERTSRWLRPSKWVIGIVGVWGVTILATWVANRHLAEPIELCMVRRSTGHPCPTCGSTRLVLSLFQGNIVGAIQINPFVFAALVVGALLLLIRVVLARRLVVRWTGMRVGVGISLLILCMLASWAYQWFVVG